MRLVDGGGGLPSWRFGWNRVPREVTRSWYGFFQEMLDRRDGFYDDYEARAGGLVDGVGRAGLEVGGCRMEAESVLDDGWAWCQHRNVLLQAADSFA